MSTPLCTYTRALRLGSEEYATSTININAVLLYAGCFPPRNVCHTAGWLSVDVLRSTIMLAVAADLPPADWLFGGVWDLQGTLSRLRFSWNAAAV